MKPNSFNDALVFDDQRVQTKVIIETGFSKEIRILLKSGQLMKEHKAPYPILIHLLEGDLELGVHGKSVIMGRGDIIALEAGIPHNLIAKTHSIVRLTVSKLDSIDRVQEAIKR